MPSYLHPGVYVEEIPSGSKPIESSGTSTAAFIGFAVKGPVNNKEAIKNESKKEGFAPVLISKWDEYEQQFGGIRDTGDSIAATQIDQMGHSVYAFFKNGGSKAYIIRVATGGASSKGILNDGTSDVLTFTAANAGLWGDALKVRISGKSGVLQGDIDKEFTVAIGTGTGDDFSALEVFSDVSLDASDPAYIVNKINDASTLVSVEADDIAAALTYLSGQVLPASADVAPSFEYEEIGFGSGADGSGGGSDDYDAVFAALLKYRDVNIMCLPGQYWPLTGSNAIVTSAISHCETMKNRMLIIDPPPGKEFGNEKDVSSLSIPPKTYAALYYPWVKVSNPYYNAETNPGVPATLSIPPSGFAAGMWAKTDGKRGVWKAPAGIATSLLGAAGLEYTVEDAEQDYLNPMGVNALRTLPNYGRVIWGARTLATKADPEWRYIPVRRTAMLIEESIFNGIQWAVFEPNNHNLWASLRSNIGSFMNGMFRAGAFQGEKASDAYFVRCGLGDTMTQGDIDRGQVIVVVGFAPLKPAEFVIVRIQQKVGQE